MKNWKKTLAAAVITLAVDLPVKQIAWVFLQNKPAVRLGSLVQFSYTENTGMALGMAQTMPWLSLVLPLLLMAVFLAVFARTETGPWGKAAIGMIIGGFCGNYLERLLFGRVVDMLYFPWLPFFVCNVADIAITFGVLILMIELLFAREKKDGNTD